MRENACSKIKYICTKKSMKRSIVALAHYIHAIINSPLTAHDLGTNFHDDHGIKYQLPCGAFLLRRPHPTDKVSDLHESLQKTWALFYCIGDVFDDDFLKVFICERDCNAPQSQADDRNCYNRIENHLYFYSNLEHAKDVHLEGEIADFDQEYYNSAFVCFREHPDSNQSLLEANHETTIPLLKAHFQKLAKFASPQKYEKYKKKIESANEQRQRQNINKKKKQKSEALISMVKELFDEERHTLTDYGHEKFMSYFETRTPEALLKLLQKSIPATPTPWMYQDPLVRGVMKQVAQEDVSNKKGEESLPWPKKKRRLHWGIHKDKGDGSSALSFSYSTCVNLHTFFINTRVNEQSAYERLHQCNCWC